MGPPAGPGRPCDQATGGVGAISTWHGRAVDEVVERRRTSPSPARVDEALDQAPVQAADQLGVGLGQLAERAVGERDRWRRRRPSTDSGSKPERGRARRRAPRRRRAGAGRRRSASAAPCSRPASTASSAAGAGARRPRRSSMRASTGNGGRLEAERRARRRPASSGAAGGRPCPGRRSRRRAGRPRACARGGAARCWGAGRGVSAISAVASGSGDAGQLEVDGVAGVVAERLQQLEPRRGRRRRRLGHAAWSLHGLAPVESAACPPPRSPPPTTSWRVLRGVIDPELGSDIVDLGMAQGAARRRRRRRSSSPIALTTAGCPLRAQIQHDVRARVGSLPGRHRRAARLDRDDARSEKSAAMAKARWNVAQRPEDTAVAADHQGRRSSPRARAASASRRSPSTSPPRSPPRGLTVGVLDADIWGFSVPRMLGVDGPPRRRGARRRRKLIVPHERTRRRRARCAIVSMGFLVEDEEPALMWRGPHAQPRRRSTSSRTSRWGDDLDYLLIDMPPGTGDVQMGVAKLLPRAEVLVVTTPARGRPEGGHPGRRRWPARATCGWPA